ncbi:MAG TPA: carboxypeptidase regulatory-like domain-containing protein [Vicinamibacterales bacterium]|nr:carboxypeptidase regulatory-like domain-containing protein [Vicinamibacterales bacterium]
MQLFHRICSTLVYAVIATATMAPAAFAQGQALDGIVEGVVRAQAGNTPVAGATVRAFNAGTGYERSVVSDEAGRYGLPLLPPGEYVVFVEAPSFATMSRTGIVLRAGQTLTVEFAMPSSSFAETVEVTATQPSVEVGRTVQSNLYDERTVRAIPTIGRSILDFFVLQPGVNAPPISSGGSGTGTPSTVYGALGLRQMNVDGVSNNLQGGARNLVISQEAVQEFQTVTNFSAEFGRVAGGLQNAFTRSGSNARHGSAYLFTRQDWLSAKPFLLAATAPKPEFQRYNYGGTAAGPVVRDRSFYFVSYERWSQDLPVVSTITPSNAAALGIPSTSIGAYTTTFRAHTVTARNDTQVNPANRLSFRYNYYYDRESPLNGGLISREVSTRFDENPYSYTAQLVSVMSPRLINEARFLYATRAISNGVSADPDAPNIDISGVGSFNGNANGNRKTQEKGIHIVDSLTMTLGRHVVKAGFDLLPVSFRERTTNINGSFVFGGLPAVSGVRDAVTPLNQFLLTEQRAIDPATGRPYSYSRFTQSIGAEYFEASTFNQGYFIQDDFRVGDRLKLNLGLRYEYFGRPKANPNPDLPLTASFAKDTNNFAPRLGFAFDPTNSGRTVIRGGAGVYYNVVVAQTYNTFLRGNGRDVINVNVTPTGTGAPAFSRSRVTPPTGVSVISDVRVMAEDYQDIRVVNWFTTLEQELVRDLAMSVTYQGNKASNLPVALNVNLSPNGVSADGRRLWSTHNRPDPRYGNIFVSSSIGEQRYDGLVAVLTKRFSAGNSFQLSYHLSKAQGTAYVNDFTGFGVFTSPSDPQDIEADRGPSDFDMRNRFSATFVYEPRVAVDGALGVLLNGWQMSSRLIASDGFRFNATTGQDHNGDTIFNDRPLGQGYNQFELPGYVTVDVRLDRRIGLGRGRKLELIAEGFNLTNRLNPTNVNRTWGPNAAANANFNTPTGAETARQFQLAARFAF